MVRFFSRFQGGKFLFLGSVCRPTYLKTLTKIFTKKLISTLWLKKTLHPSHPTPITDDPLPVRTTPLNRFLTSLIGEQNIKSSLLPPMFHLFHKHPSPSLLRHSIRRSIHTFTPAYFSLPAHPNCFFINTPHFFSNALQGPHSNPGESQMTL